MKFDRDISQEIDHMSASRTEDGADQRTSVEAVEVSEYGPAESSIEDRQKRQEEVLFEIATTQQAVRQALEQVPIQTMLLSTAWLQDHLPGKRVALEAGDLSLTLTRADKSIADFSRTMDAVQVERIDQHSLSTAQSAIESLEGAVIELSRLHETVELLATEIARTAASYEAYTGMMMEEAGMGMIRALPSFSEAVVKLRMSVDAWKSIEEDIRSMLEQDAIRTKSNS